MKSINNLRKFTSHPISFLDGCFYTQKTPITSLKLGPKNFHLIFDPDLARDILISKSQDFIQNKTIFHRIRPITGEKGLVQLNGEESRQHRQKTRPMFSQDNLERMNLLITRNTEDALKKSEFLSDLDIVQFMSDLVLKNAFGLFLGLESVQETSDMVSEFRELNHLCGNRMVALMPLPLFLPSPSNLRIKKLRDSLRSKIKTCLSGKTSSDINIHSLYSESDLLVDQCMTFLFAGHETTAASLSFTMLLLGSHPEYIKQINEGNDDTALAIYKESLRLYPPAYMLAREASTDTILHEKKISKGDQVIIGVHQIHRHPDYYSDPLNFCPERFNSSQNAFLPFGLGPKSCIGEKLAYREAVTIIRLFCRKFDFRTVDKNIHTQPLVTLHPRSKQYLKIKEVSYG